jgi:penicillin-binding protein 1B
LGAFWWWLTPDIARIDGVVALASRQPVSDHVVAAIVAVEDPQHFQRSSPLYPRAAVQAMLRARSKNELCCAATLTNQLVKSMLQEALPSRNWLRTSKEVILAAVVDAHYTRREIARSYAQVVYLGTNSGRPIIGVHEGSRLYFARRPSELSDDQVAVLVAMIHQPAALSPRVHTEVATARRVKALEAMRDHHVISQPAFEKAVRRLYSARS